MTQASRRRLRTPVAGSSVTTLELFFDLVFVFAVTRLTDLVLHSDGPRGYVEAALILLLTWWMYDAYAWLTNHVAPTTWSTRIPMLVGMACFLIMAVASDQAFTEGRWPFAVAYLVVVVVHVLAFSRSVVGEGGRVIWRVFPFNLGAAGGLLLAAALPEPWRVLGWVVGLLVIIVQVVVARGQDSFVIRAEHFAERHHLLIIIALGETVVAVGVGAEDGLTDPWRVVALVLAVAMIAALWWLYFGGQDAEGAEALARTPERSTGREALVAYSFTHILHIAGLILVAAGLHEVVHDPRHHLDLRLAVTFATGVTLFCLGEALYERRLRLGPGRLVVGGGVAALLSAAAGLLLAGGVQMVLLLGLLVVLGVRHRTSNPPATG